MTGILFIITVTIMIVVFNMPQSMSFLDVKFRKWLVEKFKSES